LAHGSRERDVPRVVDVSLEARRASGGVSRKAKSGRRGSRGGSASNESNEGLARARGAYVQAREEGSKAEEEARLRKDGSTRMSPLTQSGSSARSP